VHSTTTSARAALALRLALLAVLLGGLPRALPAQQPGTHAPLTLPAARAAARQASPDLRAAREAVAAAAARERQAAALPNPTLAYGREQTSRGGQRNAQDVAQLEQPLEIGGQRGVRREAARLRGAAAAARLAVAEAQLDFDVARAYATAVAAERRATLAEQAAGAFTDAERVSDRRLAAGDVSGYAARRLRLEAARYASLRAEAALARRTARIALASLIGARADTLALPLTLGDSAVRAASSLPDADSLRAVAVRSRAELRAAVLEADAAAAEARLAARERIPSPTLAAGYKHERVEDGVTGSSGASLSGFVAGISLPLPLFDRRQGAVEAATAETRRRQAETDALRVRVAREVDEAAESLRAVEAQVAALAPELGEGSRSAMRAVQAAYAEGEITLVEWLDAVRAYQEAESSYATLQAEAAVRRAALERAVGTPLTSDRTARGPASRE
jgi:outer membrane protein, heavy metal efflux system